MKKWIFAFTLLSGFGINAQAESCSYSAPQATVLTSISIDSQRLVLTGPTVLEMGLVQTPVTLAHGPDLLIAKYANGTTLSHREMNAEELRSGSDSALSLADYVRLLFLGEVAGATDMDEQEAQTQRDALRLGCSAVAYKTLDDVEIFSYAQTRMQGERYHAYFILVGDVVHYLDVTGTDAFANRIISTLQKRTR